MCLDHQDEGGEPQAYQASSVVAEGCDADQVARVLAELPELTRQAGSTRRGSE